MLGRILTTIQKDGAVFFPPVDERSLRFVSSLLASHRFPPLPLDYIALLKQTDGLSWNGVELYGTRANDREAKGYTLPGLIEANLEFQQVPPMRGSEIPHHQPLGLYKQLHFSDFFRSVVFVRRRTVLNGFRFFFLFQETEHINQGQQNARAAAQADVDIRQRRKNVQNFAGHH